MKNKNFRKTAASKGSKNRADKSRAGNATGKYLNASGGNSKFRDRRRSGNVDTEMICGKNPVKEMLLSNISPKRLYVRENDKSAKGVILSAESKNIPVDIVDNSFFSQNFKDENHQNIALEIEPYKYHDLRSVIKKLDSKRFDEERHDKPLIVILDKLTDPHNLGSIVRSCVAFDVDAIVIPKHNSVHVNSTVWKTSSGLVKNIKICRETNLVNSIKLLKENGFFVIGLDSHTDKILGKTGLENEPLALVMGSEGKGISKLTADNCDELALIKTNNSVESLNVSVATGIALYEINKCR